MVKNEISPISGEIDKHGKRGGAKPPGTALAAGSEFETAPRKIRVNPLDAVTNSSGFLKMQAREQSFFTFCRKKGRDFR